MAAPIVAPEDRRDIFCGLSEFPFPSAARDRLPDKPGTSCWYGEGEGPEARREP